MNNLKKVIRSKILASAFLSMLNICSATAIDIQPYQAQQEMIRQQIVASQQRVNDSKQKLVEDLASIQKQIDDNAKLDVVKKQKFDQDVASIQQQILASQQVSNDTKQKFDQDKVLIQQRVDESNAKYTSVQQKKDSDIAAENQQYEIPKQYEAWWRGMGSAVQARQQMLNNWVSARDSIKQQYAAKENEWQKKKDKEISGYNKRAGWYDFWGQRGPHNKKVNAFQQEIDKCRVESAKAQKSYQDLIDKDAQLYPAWQKFVSRGGGDNAEVAYNNIIAGIQNIFNANKQAYDSELAQLQQQKELANKSYEEAMQAEVRKQEELTKQSELIKQDEAVRQQQFVVIQADLMKKAEAAKQADVALQQQEGGIQADLERQAELARQKAIEEEAARQAELARQKAIEEEAARQAELARQKAIEEEAARQAELARQKAIEEEAARQTEKEALQKKYGEVFYDKDVGEYYYYDKEDGEYYYCEEGDDKDYYDESTGKYYYYDKDDDEYYYYD